MLPAGSTARAALCSVGPLWPDRAVCSSKLHLCGGVGEQAAGKHSSWAKWDEVLRSAYSSPAHHTTAGNTAS